MSIPRAYRLEQREKSPRPRPHHAIACAAGSVHGYIIGGHARSAAGTRAWTRGTQGGREERGVARQGPTAVFPPRHGPREGPWDVLSAHVSEVVALSA